MQDFLQEALASSENSQGHEKQNRRLTKETYQMPCATTTWVLNSRKKKPKSNFFIEQLGKYQYGLSTG